MREDSNERRKTVLGEEDECEEGEYGSRELIRKRNPRMPSEDERRAHEVTHIPYRDWCRHCVRGWGVEEACRTLEGRGAEIPEVHMDYMFMGEEDGSGTLAVLVARERETKATFAIVVPRKSTG